MGLDQYAYAVEKGLIPEGQETDFTVKHDDNELHYWRKNNYLQGWMQGLYERKGGTQEFNCVNVKLTESDLKELYNAINDQTLEHTSGFFFGSDYDYYGLNGDAGSDLEFVTKALAEIEKGREIYYTSWW